MEERVKEISIKQMLKKLYEKDFNESTLKNNVLIKNTMVSEEDFRLLVEQVENEVIII